MKLLSEKVDMEQAFPQQVANMEQSRQGGLRWSDLGRQVYPVASWLAE
jgi:hypothetical protein